MSIRSDGSGDFLSSTAGMPPNNVFTIMGWFRRLVDTGSAESFFGIGSPDPNFITVQIDNSEQWTIWNGTGNATSTTNVMPVGVWYHITLTCNGVGAGLLKLYCNSFLRITSTSGSITNASIRICDDQFGGEFLNGTVFNVKIWSAALSETEIQKEMKSFAPFRKKDLNRWTPLFNINDVNDYSGNRRHWTKNGTLLTGTNPPHVFPTPVSFQQKSIEIFKPSSSGGVVLVSANILFNTSGDLLSTDGAFYSGIYIFTNDGNLLNNCGRTSIINLVLINSGDFTSNDVRSTSSGYSLINSGDLSVIDGNISKNSFSVAAAGDIFVNDGRISQLVNTTNVSGDSSISGGNVSSRNISLSPDGNITLLSGRISSINTSIVPAGDVIFVDGRISRNGFSINASGDFNETGGRISYLSTVYDTSGDLITNCGRKSRQTLSVVGDGNLVENGGKFNKLTLSFNEGGSYPVILDDFTSNRNTMDNTQPIWQPYLSINPSQTYSIAYGTLTLNVGSSLYSDGVGTSTGSNTSSTLNDTSKTWTVGQFNSLSGPALINITSGLGVGQWSTVVDNTSTRVTVSPSWTITPNSSSHYAIYYPEGPYLQFFPNGDTNGYTFPDGYAQRYVKSGRFNANCNKLIFWISPNVSIPRRSDGGSVGQIGTYIRQKAETNTTYQGQHYYHIVDTNLYANQWHQVVLNRQTQHQVGGNTNYNWPDDPEFQVGSFTNNGATNTFPSVSENGAHAQIHYFEGLTRLYWEYPASIDWPDPSVLYNSTWLMKNAEFVTNLNEPDSLVSSIISVYNGTAYELSWAGPKNTSQSYTVYYGSVPLQNTNGSYNGLGTSMGTTSNTADSYTGVFIQSPTMAQQPVIYFFILPSGSSTGTQVIMTPSPQFNLYSGGDIQDFVVNDGRRSQLSSTYNNDGNFSSTDGVRWNSIFSINPDGSFSEAGGTFYGKTLSLINSGDTTTSDGRFSRVIFPANTSGDISLNSGRNSIIVVSLLNSGDFLESAACLFRSTINVNCAGDFTEQGISLNTVSLFSSAAYNPTGDLIISGGALSRNQTSFINVGDFNETGIRLKQSSVNINPSIDFLSNTIRLSSFIFSTNTAGDINIVNGRISGFNVSYFPSGDFSETGRFLLGSVITFNNSGDFFCQGASQNAVILFSASTFNCSGDWSLQGGLKSQNRILFDNTNNLNETGIRLRNSSSFIDCSGDFLSTTVRGTFNSVGFSIDGNFGEGGVRLKTSQTNVNGSFDYVLTVGRKSYLNIANNVMGDFLAQVVKKTNIQLSSTANFQCDGYITIAGIRRSSVRISFSPNGTFIVQIPSEEDSTYIVEFLLKSPSTIGFILKLDDPIINTLYSPTFINVKG